MKPTIVLFFALFFSIGIHAQTQLNVGSYNLRYLHEEVDTLNNWKYRSPAVFNLIDFYDFDLLGTQEGYTPQLKDIAAALPAYAYYGVGRIDGKDQGEQSAVFYKKDKFTLLDKGSFWLSQTPDTPSFGWDAACTRVCSWVKLQDKRTKKKFYFFNTHFDHVGKEARLKSSVMITEKVKEIAGSTPAILTGDFNAGQSTVWYNNIANCGWLSDSYKLSAKPYAINGTFNAFGATVKKSEIIDHIFLSKDFSVKKYSIISDTYRGRYPSDHFPVMIQASF